MLFVLNDSKIFATRVSIVEKTEKSQAVIFFYLVLVTRRPMATPIRAAEENSSRTASSWLSVIAWENAWAWGLNVRDGPSACSPVTRGLANHPA